ncbi:hypothetical protein E2C01_041404 [Portunus trituberculatus]|uniref:Uncharacterized protein n=1 Tax=Portunus trituberculatus TaxID=210409 RepID=A0A5B7FJZ4_PORTR|nr:hypothetical protein [Portunus trituberculatus]
MDGLVLGDLRILVNHMLGVQGGWSERWQCHQLFLHAGNSYGETSLCYHLNFNFNNNNNNNNYHHYNYYHFTPTTTTTTITSTTPFHIPCKSDPASEEGGGTLGLGILYLLPHVPACNGKPRTCNPGTQISWKNLEWT